MVGLFRDKSFINIFLLIVLSVVIHFHFLTEPPAIDTNSGTNDGLISLILDRYITTWPSVIRLLLYHGLVLVQAIRLNLALNELRMYQSSNYLPAMTYILLTAIIPQWCAISPALVSNSLVIWIFVKLSRLYNHSNPKTLLFNTGMITGLSVLCYHPMAILVGVVLFALAVVRPFRLAEWLILLMGIALPYYFVLSGLFLTNRLPEFQSMVPDFYLGSPEGAAGSVFLRGVIGLGVSLLCGLFFWQVSINRMVIQIRKNWGVMMVMLLTLLPVPFIFQLGGLESGILCLIPISAFVANAFSNPRNLSFPNLLFIAIVIIIALNNWYLLKN
ncbi:MAG: hypothetical protein IBJ16_02540 [Chitinophagaceae bacterium]|nr:hypothetical protein [Chitinophagaceae bacterium]